MVMVEQVKTFPAWREYVKKQSMAKKKTNETSAEQKRKQAKREKEAREAEALYRKIQGKQQQKRDADAGSIVVPSKRGFESLLGSLEAKYAKKGKSAKQKAAARGPSEPSEDEFRAAQKRLESSRKK